MSASGMRRCVGDNQVICIATQPSSYFIIHFTLFKLRQCSGQCSFGSLLYREREFWSSKLAGYLLPRQMRLGHAWPSVPSSIWYSKNLETSKVSKAANRVSRTLTEGRKVCMLSGANLTIWQLNKSIYGYLHEFLLGGSINTNVLDPNDNWRFGQIHVETYPQVSKMSGVSHCRLLVAFVFLISLMSWRRFSKEFISTECPEKYSALHCTPMCFISLPLF